LEEGEGEDLVNGSRATKADMLVASLIKELGSPLRAYVRKGKGGLLARTRSRISSVALSI
jgi:hypothetical protein